MADVTRQAAWRILASELLGPVLVRSLLPCYCVYKTNRGLNRAPIQDGRGTYIRAGNHGKERRKAVKMDESCPLAR